MVNSRKGSSIPLVPVTQVCTQPEQGTPASLVLGQRGAISSGARSFVPQLEMSSLTPAGCSEDAYRLDCGHSHHAAMREPSEDKTC